MPSATLRNLSVLSYANGFTLFHYRSGEHTMGEISAPGYFDAAEWLKPGDVIICQDLNGLTSFRNVWLAPETKEATRNKVFLVCTC